ncbi:MAG: alpha/beta fold hydrolase, partial [Bacteroidota bacterium]
MKHSILSFVLVLVGLANLSAQKWVDKTDYPFKNNYIELEAGKQHYVDEGEGDVILFLHGTPTWSFLYRDFIKKLSSRNRCIAIDYLDFGLSEKPLDFKNTPKNHAANLEEFITKLDLTNITLVVHDFGGSIGLSTAIKNPEKFKRIVVFNTWMWETKNDPFAKEIDGLLHSEAGKKYYLEQNYSVEVLMKQAYFKKSKLTEKIHQQYREPFPDSSSREALLELGKEFVGSSDWFQMQWEKLDVLKEKEWLIIWGMKDPFLNEKYLEK